MRGLQERVSSRVRALPVRSGYVSWVREGSQNHHSPHSRWPEAAVQADTVNEAWAAFRDGTLGTMETNVPREPPNARMAWITEAHRVSGRTQDSLVGPRAHAWRPGPR